MAEPALTLRADGPTPYETWIAREGVPAIQAYGVTDLADAEHGRWERLGADACFVLLHGMEGFTGMCSVVLPPGGSTHPVQHLYEMLVYVLAGRGSTTLEGRDGSTVQFEWQEGSLFAIPLNVRHQFFNGSGSEPARYIAVTTAPLIFDLLHSEDFIYGTSYAFRDRFDGTSDYVRKDNRLEGPGETLLGSFSLRGWEINYVADARAVLPEEVSEAKRSLRFISYEPGGNSLIVHESKYPSGSYMQAHHHCGGAILCILRSQGYSLMWPNSLGDRPFESGHGDQVVRIDWKPGSVFSPRTGWYHQHFNTGPTDALQLAFRYGSHKYPMGIWRALGGGEAEDGRSRVMVSRRRGGNIIPYDDEDPAMRRMFNEGLERNGVKPWVRQ
jgi:quercetin dioxygenase-like cupin family protein